LPGLFDDLVDGVEADTEAVFSHSGQRGEDNRSWP
jgi:hypothetical protein